MKRVSRGAGINGSSSQIKLRFLFDVKSGATPKSSVQDYWDGDIWWITPEDLGSLKGREIFSTRRTLSTKGYKNCGAEIVPSESLVLSKRAPIGQLAILKVEASCNQGCFLLVPKANLDTRFYYYYLLQLRSHLEILGRGSTFMELSLEDLLSLSLPHPDIAIQHYIADHLDRETAQINELIAEKENMLQLLEEKRAAMTSRVVTRGLDGEVEMKDSGLEWLGKIPIHWKVKRAKQLFFIRDERSETGEEELLTVSHITGVTPRSEKNVYMFKSEDMTGYKLCYSGDLVVNTLWAWMGAMGVASHNGIVSPEYHVYVSKGIILPSYIEMLCRSNPFVAEVIRHSKGVWSSRLRLYPDAFFSIFLPVPPKEEQEDIVYFLANERLRTSKLESDLKHSISLLKERRSALITAAVTNQLELQTLSI